MVHRSAPLLMANYGPVCIAAWSSKPTRELFDIQQATLVAAAAKNPGRCQFLCIISAKADPPDQDIRSASSAMVSNVGPQLAGLACVIEGSGFRAAITRTVLTGIIFIVRKPCPFSFFDTVPNACSWLSSHALPNEIDGLAEALAKAR